MITSEEAGRLYRGSSSSRARAPSARVSLRALARRPLEERHRAILAGEICVDVDEAEAWDLTAGDAID